jgi:hypothetical protein
MFRQNNFILQLHLFLFPMKTYSFLLLLVYATCSFAQTKVADKHYEESHNWLSLNIGLSIPSGDYGDDDVQSEDAGLADAGVFFKADLGVRCYENIGVIFTPFLGRNAILWSLCRALF